MSVEITDQFECIDDDGNRYTVIETTISNTISHASGSRSIIPAGKNFRLLSGDEVEQMHGDEWKIVESDKIIRKV